MNIMKAAVTGGMVAVFVLVTGCGSSGEPRGDAGRAGTSAGGESANGGAGWGGLGGGSALGSAAGAAGATVSATGGAGGITPVSSGGARGGSAGTATDTASGGKGGQPSATGGIGGGPLVTATGGARAAGSGGRVASSSGGAASGGMTGATGGTMGGGIGGVASSGGSPGDPCPSSPCGTGDYCCRLPGAAPFCTANVQASACVLPGTGGAGVGGSPDVGTGGAATGGSLGTGGAAGSGGDPGTGGASSGGFPVAFCAEVGPYESTLLCHQSATVTLPDWSDAPHVRTLPCVRGHASLSGQPIISDVACVNLAENYLTSGQPTQVLFVADCPSPLCH